MVPGEFALGGDIIRQTSICLETWRSGGNQPPQTWFRFDGIAIGSNVL